VDARLLGAFAADSWQQPPDSPVEVDTEHQRVTVGEPGWRAQ